MTAPDSRLGDWLRRLRLTTRPEDLDLGTPGRPRTSYISQAALARAAGVTLRTYTEVERGRRHPGARLVEGLESALRMDATQRAHLRRLLRPGPPPAVPVPRPVLGTVVGGIRWPAVAFDHRWTVLAANSEFRALIAPAPDNLAEWVLGQGGRETLVDWRSEARLLVARWRATQAYYPPDPEADAEMTRWCRPDPYVWDLWRRGAEVADDPPDRVVQLRTDAGVTQVGVTLLRAGEAPDLRIAICRLPT